MPDIHAEWQDLLRTGMRAHQQTILKQEAKFRSYRVFEPMIVPGLLQVPDYARVCLSHSAPLFGPRDDVDEAVLLRMQRQEILHDADRHFHFIVTEAALRYLLCEPEVMLRQLDHLIPLCTHPTVKLGIIGFGARYRAAFPSHGFWLHDDELVNLETFSAEIRISNPSEIEVYAKVFDSLAGIASYGEAARQIIQRVIDDLSAEVGEDPPTG